MYAGRYLPWQSSTNGGGQLIVGVLILFWCSMRALHCTAPVKYWTSLIISRADTVCVVGGIKRLQHLICTVYTAHCSVVESSPGREVHCQHCWHVSRTLLHYTPPHLITTRDNYNLQLSNLWSENSNGYNNTL